MIAITFECGCKSSALGTERARPLCPAHNKPILRVEAPKPRITGVVQSPLKVTK